MNEKRINVRERRYVREPVVHAPTERAIDSDVTPMADRPAEHHETPVAVNAESHTTVVSEEAAPRGVVHRHPAWDRVAMAVNYVFFIVYLALGTRLALTLLRADPAAGFVQWLNGATEPLFAPFRGIFPTVTIEGGHTIALSLVFAILVYAVLHALVVALLRVVAPRRVIL